MADPLTKNPITEKTNLNTDTVMVDKYPTEYLSARPPPIEASFNVFELKKQPEIVRYYHAAPGFPTNRAGTHKIEVSNIILFMHSIQPYMHKTDTHNCFFKKIDQDPFKVEPEVEIMEYFWVVMVV